MGSSFSSPDPAPTRPTGVSHIVVESEYPVHRFELYFGHGPDPRSVRLMPYNREAMYISYGYLGFTTYLLSPNGKIIMQFARNWFSSRYTGITNMNLIVPCEVSFDLDYPDCKVTASFQNWDRNRRKTTWVLCDPYRYGKEAEIKSHGRSIAKIKYSKEGCWPFNRHCYDIRVQAGFDDVLAIAMCIFWHNMSGSPAYGEDEEEKVEHRDDYEDSSD